MGSVSKDYIDDIHYIGIEFEVSYSSRTKINDLIYNNDKYDRIIRDVTGDASLTMGSEIITQPLRLSWRNIKTALMLFEDILRNRYGVVDTSCGTHMHFSSPKRKISTASKYVKGRFKGSMIKLESNNTFTRSVKLHNVLYTYYIILERYINDIGFVAGRLEGSYTYKLEHPYDYYMFSCITCKYNWANLREVFYPTIEYRIPRYVIPEQYAAAIAMFKIIHEGLFEVLTEINRHRRYTPDMMAKPVRKSVLAIRTAKEILTKYLTDIGLLESYKTRVFAKANTAPVHTRHEKKLTLDKALENAYNIYQSIIGGKM